MARLLQRMRGGAASEVTASMHKPTTAAYQQANEEKAQAKARAEEEAAKAAKPKREYVHTPAPENRPILPRCVNWLTPRLAVLYKKAAANKSPPKP